MEQDIFNNNFDNITPERKEEIINLIGDENGETQIVEHEGQEIKIARKCPAKWRCNRCGNIYQTIAMPRVCECHSKQFELFYDDEKDLIDFYIFNTEYFAIQLQSILLNNQKALATELLTKVVKDKFPFYTTRHDELAEIWTYENGIYVPNGKTFIKEFCRKVLEDQYTVYLANCVIGKVEADTYIDAQTFFNNNLVDEIPCLNGIINLRTKELMPFNQNKIHFIKIPVTYDPNATCPKIDDFFKSLLPSEDDVKTTYELIGYCLWKTYKLEKAAVLLGEGSNGKDTLLELIKRFLGAENTKSIPLGMLEKDDFAESELFQKLANLAGELSKNAIKEDSKFKMITGRSQLSASRKFKEKLTFVNFSKQIFAANSLPKIEDTTDGFWRRWIYLQFPYKFESAEVIEQMKLANKDISKMKVKDPDLLEKICIPEEFSGLLNRVMNAVNEVWDKKSFTSSTSSEETSMFWVRKSDSFLAFALENVEQSPEGYVLKESVRKAYQRYCKANKVSNETDKHIAKIMQVQFGAMDSRKVINEKQEYVWEGVQLKNSLL